MPVGTKGAMKALVSDTMS
jgi:queuine tRNA-ribosyltransferase